MQSARGRTRHSTPLTVKTHKDGKKHLGWSCPANPALIVPEPYIAEHVLELKQSMARRKSTGRRTNVVDHDGLVREDVLELGRHPELLAAVRSVLRVPG